MARASTMIVLIFCSILILLTQDAKALELAMVEPENCYLVAVSPEDEQGGHTTTALDIDNNTLLSQTQPELAHSPSSSLLAELEQQMPTIVLYLTKLELNALPIPASLLFIGIWLIGFKLTSQPPPSLNRAQPSRFSKAYMVMSMGKK